MEEVKVDLVIEDPRWEKILSNLNLDFKEIGGRAVQCSGYCFAKVAHIAIFFTNDEEIRKLNKEYRGKDKATNVLSFPQEYDEAEEEILPFVNLGDIFLSIDTLEKEIENTDKSFKDHLLHLTIHGIYHLLGLDHEGDEEEAEDMERKEIEALEYFNVKSPY